MSTATMTSKGQITIPAIVRSALGVEAGDQVEFVQVEPGRFEITVGGKQPGFAGLADAATTQTVSGTMEVAGKELVLDP